jgi:hypothetical protein
MTFGALYAELIDPLAEALNASNERDFRTAYDVALDAATEGRYDEDASHALRLIAEYHNFLASLHFSEDRAYQERMYFHCLELIAQPAAGPLSHLAQRRLLLQHRILGDTQQILSLSEAAFHSLLDGLKPEERHTEQWMYIARYCYDRHLTGILRQAYEEYILSHSSWEREYVWRRLDLMLKIREERATADDVRLFLSQIFTSAAYHELKHSLWPELKEQGVITPELEFMLTTHGQDLLQREEQEMAQSREDAGR